MTLGIPDLLMLLVKLTQNMMSSKLQYLSELQCFTDDHQLLTSSGFKWVSQLVETDYIATYNSTSQQIEYCQPDQVIHRNTRSDEQLCRFESAAEFANWSDTSDMYGRIHSSNDARSNHVSLTVTGDHTMYVKPGREYISQKGNMTREWKQYVKQSAAELVTADDKAVIKFLASAANGLDVSSLTSAVTFDSLQSRNTHHSDDDDLIDLIVSEQQTTPVALDKQQHKEMDYSQTHLVQSHVEPL